MDRFYMLAYITPLKKDLLWFIGFFFINLTL